MNFMNYEGLAMWLVAKEITVPVSTQVKLGSGLWDLGFTWTKQDILY